MQSCVYSLLVRKVKTLPVSHQLSQQRLRPPESLHATSNFVPIPFRLPTLFNPAERARIALTYGSEFGLTKFRYPIVRGKFTGKI